MQTRLAPLLSALTLALVSGQLAAYAEGDTESPSRSHGWEDDDHSHDRARRAMESGEILTMIEILRRIRPQAPGRVLDTELEHEHGRWIYEIKFLDPQGRLYELEIDAQNGQILRRWEGE